MQKQKIQMSKRRFRIGELAKKLKIKKFVIRFWEKEFELLSSRSNGGQRFYSQEDAKTFILIKELLYNQKFTIPGAKKQITALKNKTKQLSINNISPAITTTPLNTEKIKPEQKTVSQQNFQIPQKLLQKLNTLKQQLIKFKKTL